MAGAQFKQNHPKFVKLNMRYHTAEAVGYSRWPLVAQRYTFTHDSFLPTSIPKRSSPAPGPDDGRTREDAL